MLAALTSCAAYKPVISKVLLPLRRRSRQVSVPATTVQAAWSLQLRSLQIRSGCGDRAQFPWRAPRFRPKGSMCRQYLSRRRQPGTQPQQGQGRPPRAQADSLTRYRLKTCPWPSSSTLFSGRCSDQLFHRQIRRDKERDCHLEYEDNGQAIRNT